MPPSIWSSTDYALDWPAALLRDELTNILRTPYSGWTISEAVQLLELAFHTAVPVQRFHEFVGRGPDQDVERATQWIEDLIRHADQLRTFVPRAPYWRTRAAGGESPQHVVNVHRRFEGLASALSWHGFFGRDTYSPCPYDAEEPAFVFDLDTELGYKVGPSDVWSSRYSDLTWTDDTFYQLVEVLHDLAARPRRRWWHQEEDCPGHYHHFDTDSGRRIYRTLVNLILADAGIDLRLAAAGEDEGRLVKVVDEARSELTERALASPEPDATGRIEHAIALFRGRAASEHDKRSAIVALATVLEDRKRLLKSALFTDDESALFHIANRFDLRHRNDKQHTDYDPAFRDWVFWWYLATIELTDRLLARQSAAAAGT